MQTVRSPVSDVPHQQSPSDPYRSMQKHNPQYMEHEMYLEPSSNSTYIRDKPGRNAHEHDSGVLDVDSIHPDFDSPAATPRNSNTNVNSSGSLTSPPYNYKHQIDPPSVPFMGTKRPDSLAVKGHEYEELPGQKYLGPQYSYTEPENNNFHPTPSKSIKFGGSKENLCHSGSNGTLRSEKPAPTTYRKRQNPLYEEEKDMVLRKPKSNSGLCHCPCLAILIFSALSLISFLLCILMVAGVISVSDSDHGYPKTGASTAENNYSVEYTELLQKIRQLENEIATNHNSVNGKVEELENRIDDIDENIDNVRKMQGPRGYNGTQGPPGAGDLSQCTYVFRSGSSAIIAKAESPWYPANPNEDQDRVIMGLECSVTDGKGGTSILETSTAQSRTQFRCVCPPVPGETGNHNCFIHIWHCPKES